MGLTSPDDLAEGQREVREAVATFMAAWGSAPA
jgi:hypothetical protein